jgi:crotonobetainyl-CoA:carnitine CoA-transferase CaiB-like acyl-CoA transferase
MTEPTGAEAGPGQPVLAGTRVLDLSSGIAGAYCAKLLVDAGADAVVVEPPEGQPLRHRAAPGRTLEQDEDGALFRFLHTGTGSVVATAEDRPGTVARLVARADVVVVDAAPPDRTAATLATAHPDLIVVSLSPFGLQGPWSERVASDLTLQALSSSIAGRGERHGSPVKAGGELVEWASGAAAAVAVLVALRRRNLTGLGELIDLAHLEVAITIFNGFRAVSGQLVPAGPPPYQVVEVPSVEPAADGWIGFATLSADQFASFAAMIERPEWAIDPEISRIDGRIDRAADVRQGIADWTTRHTVDEIMTQAGARRVPSAPLGDGVTTPKLPHLVDRGAFVPHPGTDYVQPRVPYRLERTWQPPLRLPPVLGSATTEEVAASWDRPSPARPRAAAPQADGQNAGAIEAAEAAEADLPLRGIRVFDLTSFWAGPYASQILGFFGAEVIKVESIQRPDGTRMATSYGIRGDQTWERAPLFQAVNSGKRAVTLDLGDQRGRDLGRRLLAQCDVLVENYSPRVVERFGLLDEKRSDRITLRMPAWGLSGPWRDLPGFAQTMEQASGLASVTGFPDGPPLIPRGPCDPIGALHGAFAVLAAILDRDRTGLGQLVEVPLVESALNVAAEQFVEWGASGTLLGRHGNAHPKAAPHGVYRTAGGAWVAIAVMDDAQWRLLVDVVGEPAWRTDPALAEAAGRAAARDRLDQGLAAWCAVRSPGEIVDALWPIGVPAAPLVAPHEVVSLPQTESRGFFETVVHPVIGSLRLPAFPARLTSRALPYHRSHAPLLGQDNQSILGGWLGLDDDEVAALSDAGVIGTRPL